MKARIMRRRRKSHIILLIDDGLEELEPIATTFCAEGHIVRSATHGNDLLWLAHVLNPDIVVTNIVMHDFDTFHVLVGLRVSHPDLKIIAISENEQVLAVASRLGADSILAKPFPVQKLDQLIRAALQLP